MYVVLPIDNRGEIALLINKIHMQYHKEQSFIFYSCFKRMLKSQVLLNEQRLTRIHMIYNICIYNTYETSIRHYILATTTSIICAHIDAQIFKHTNLSY
jgi:hypothetical protein